MKLKICFEKYFRMMNGVFRIGFLYSVVRHMKPSLPIFSALSFLFLSACNEEMSPLVAGSVSYTTQEKIRVEKPLTKQQLQSLSVWLARGSSNWSRCWATPPLITIEISLKHKDGTTSSLSLLNYTNSQTTLLAQHLSGSNLSDKPCAVQSFSQKEIDALRELLEVPMSHATTAAPSSFNGSVAK